MNINRLYIRLANLYILKIPAEGGEGKLNKVLDNNIQSCLRELINENIHRYLHISLYQSHMNVLTHDSCENITFLYKIINS